MKIKHKVLVNFMRNQTGLAPSRHPPFSPLLILPFACSNKAINCGKTYSESGRECESERQSTLKLIGKNIKVMLGQLVLEIVQNFNSSLHITHTPRSDRHCWLLMNQIKTYSNRIKDKSNQSQIQIKFKIKVGIKVRPFK